MKNIAICIGLLALALAGLPAGRAIAEDEGHKFALVIGNGAYRFQDPLETAGTDTAAVARALRSLGFEVIEQTNLGNGAFRAALNEFSKLLRPGGLALFYFMGYAVQVEGGNFLLPVGNELRRSTDRITHAIPLNAVLHIMDRGQSRADVILLDAAYPDRISESQNWSAPGLAATEVPGGSTLIAYSAWPGSEIAPPSGGSLFAQELATALARPNPELIAVMESVTGRIEARSNGAQRPWIGPGFERRIALGEGALEPAAKSQTPKEDYLEVSKAATADHEFVRPGTQPEPADARPDPPISPPAARRPAPLDQDQDQDQDEYTKALDRISQAIAQDSAQSAAQVQPPAGTAFERTLSPRERGLIQRDLKTLGLYKSGVDRIFGPGTRSGIRKLQADLGEETTGYLTESQRKSLGDRAAERRESIQIAEAAARQRAKKKPAAVKKPATQVPSGTASSRAAPANSGRSKSGGTTAGRAGDKTPGRASSSQSQATAQQAAAPSKLPFGTSEEAEAFLKSQANIKETLQRYNKTKFLVEHQGIFKISYIDSLRVVRLAGDRITARITFTVATRGQNSTSGTFDFVILWRKSGIEIQSHARK